MRIIRDILTPDVCQELIELAPTLDDNFETFAGGTGKRKIVNGKWSPIPFNLYRLTLEESNKYCEIIAQHLSGYEITSFRVMHYPPGSFISDHYDAWLPEEGESHAGMIVQLNDPNSYKGGYLTIENELISLAVGDGVIYDYSELHGVKTVKESDRWISNIRLRKIS